MRDFAHLIATAQALTAAAVSENTMDLGAADKNLGNAVLYMHILVTVDFAGLDSGCRLHPVDSASSDLSSDRALGAFTSTTASDDVIIPVGDLTAGTHLICALPPGIKYKRYLGFAFVPVSENASAGKVDAWVSNVAGEIDLQ
jgi:hypothetical protein